MHDGKVITITSGKGGVGKSTVTTNFAHFISYLGYKTLIIDMDIGLRTLDIMLGIDETKIKYDLIELTNNISLLEETLMMVKNKNDNLFLINASEYGNKEALNQLKFEKLLYKLKQDFDYIIIDSPAGIETGFYNSVNYSDHIILTVSPDIFSLKDADKVLNILDENKRKNKQTNISFIINKYIPLFADFDPNFNIENIQKKLGIPILGIIEFDPKIIKSTDIGRPYCFSKEFKSSEEMRNIVKRFLGNKIPIASINNGKSFFAKLKKLIS